MRLAVGAILLVLACGGRSLRPPKPDTIYYWKVCTSTVELSDNCSDDPMFRAANHPLPFEPGSHLIYKVSPDAKTAAMMTCKSLDPRSCEPAPSGVVFDVAGAELTYSTEERTPTGFGVCSLASAWSWTLTDWNTTLEVVISDTLSLVDDPAACDTVEANAKSRSPNMKGFQGCTITFKLGTVPPDKNC